MRNLQSYDSFRLIEESASIHPPKDWKCEMPGEGSSGGIIKEIPQQLQKRMVEVLREISTRSNDSAVKGAIGDICSGRSRDERREDIYSDTVVLDMGGERLTVWALGHSIRVGADMSSGGSTGGSEKRAKAKPYVDRLINFLETGEDNRPR